MRLLCTVILWFACVAARADDIMHYIESDKSILNDAADITVGKVVSIEYPDPIKKSCFSYVYTLQVTRSIKSIYPDDELLQIGSLQRSMDLLAGDAVLVVLNESKKGEYNFYDYCKLPRLSKNYSKDKMKVAYGSVSTTFRIRPEGKNGSQQFYAISCGKYKRILLQDVLEKLKATKVLDEADCTTITGDYNDLVDAIQGDMD